MPRTHKTFAISLHPKLREAALVRATELGFQNSFSAYVAKLIGEDVRNHAPADTIITAAALDPAQQADLLRQKALAEASRKSGNAPATYSCKGKAKPRLP